MRVLAILAFLFVIVPLLILAAGQFGFLAGRPPPLGVSTDSGVTPNDFNAIAKTPSDISVVQR